MTTQTMTQNSNSWLAKIARFGFAFFLIKGLLWLAALVVLGDAAWSVL
ncbi:MAG: hypothetical protein ACR2PS_02650 [Pseudomonadales bacterium]